MIMRRHSKCVCQSAVGREGWGRWGAGPLQTMLGPGEVYSVDIVYIDTYLLSETITVNK